MLAELPIMSLGEYDQVNNLNLRQLNGVFDRMSLNDRFLSAVLARTPKIYEHGRTYLSGDCVWLNTEYWREFIDFPDHARHITSAYSARIESLSSEEQEQDRRFKGESTGVSALFYDTVRPVISAGYDEEIHAIMLVAKNTEIDGGFEKIQLDYSDEQLCKQLINYSYMVGDLHKAAFLYRCTPENDTVSCVADVYSGLEFKKELDSNWTPVYANDDDINTEYLSALVRTIISAHAMSFYPLYDETSAHLGYSQMLSTEISALTPFDSEQPVYQILPGYTPYKNGSIHIEDLVKNNVSGEFDQPSVVVSADNGPRSIISAGFDYYKYDTTLSDYVLQNFSATGSGREYPDNIWYLHGELEAKFKNKAAAKYVNVGNFDIDLSSLLSVVSKYPDPFVVATIDKPGLNYIIYQKQDTNKTTKIWLDGTVEIAGTAQAATEWINISPLQIGSTRYTLELPAEDKRLVLSSAYDTSGSLGKISYFMQCRVDPASVISVLNDAGISRAAMEFMDYVNSITIKKNIVININTGGDNISNYIEVSRGDGPPNFDIIWSAIKLMEDSTAESPEIPPTVYSNDESIVNTLFNTDDCGVGVYTLTITAPGDAEWNEAVYTTDLSVTGEYTLPGSDNSQNLESTT